eukprot:Hpha_TRINITY_DN10458_c0_g1::TRINITY_DN10458_c0_g1_i1::g.193546::m.193546/K06170/PSENEN, PEN2; presenilin enhancer 2
MFNNQPLTKERAERIAKQQFLWGFALLPWLWVSNYLYFWEIQSQNEVVRYWCRLSLGGFVAACLLIIIYWIVLRQSPESALWVIHPGREEYQNGLFSDGVYSANLGG